MALAIRSIRAWYFPYIQQFSNLATPIDRMIPNYFLMYSIVKGFIFLALWFFLSDRVREVLNKPV